MANLTINGRTVTVDDSFRDLPREEQEAMVEHIASSLPSDEKKTKEASGVVAGMKHGLDELVNGPAETLKQYAGVGRGRKDDPNYVGTDFFGGSINPANWNYSQIPQIVAENAPSLGAGATAAAAGAKTAKTAGMGKKAQMIAALASAGLYGFGSSAGDTAKEAAVARTGDANAETNSSDLTRGAVTAAAANAVGALAPTRFVPGMNKITNVGAQGVADAAKKYLGTAAIGAGSGAASDAVTQAGTKLGTDANIDLNRIANAGAAGGLTSGAMATPQLAGDAVRARNLREFGGENLDATKNYATRLAEAGDGVGGLGNAKRDAEAHRLTRGNIQRELKDASKNITGLSPDANNALENAATGKQITPKDLALIESATAGQPDGANAAFLARTLRMAQLAQEKGNYTEGKGWAGGMSGKLDANLGYLLNPTRLLGTAVATGMGMHLLGMSNPMFAGSVAAGYGGARMVDGMTGMRSPAKSFAEHFADSSARLRLPQTQPPAPAGPPQTASPLGPRPPMSGPTGPAVAPPGAPTPQMGPQGPWGPRPMPGLNPTGPVAGPRQGPPAPPPAAPAAQPNISPLAMMMLKQKLKAGLPPEPAPPAPAPAPVATKPDISPMALSMLKQKLKQGLPPEVAPPAAPAPEAPQPQVMPKLTDLVKPTPTEVPTEALTKAKRLMAGLKTVQKLKENALAPTGEPASLGAAETTATADVTAPKTMADVLRNSELRAAAAKPKTIKKVNGKVQEEAPPKAPEPPKDAPFEPFEPDDPRVLYERGTTAESYGRGEAARKGVDSERYVRNATKTAKDWIRTTNLLSAKYAGYKPSFEATLHHLLNIGSNVTKRRAAIDHFAEHVPPDIAAEMRELYK